VFFVTMTYGAVVSFLALYAQTMNVTNVGPFFTMYAITLMITRPLFGRIADKKGFDTVMLPGILCVLATMLILFAARNRPVFMLAQLQAYNMLYLWACVPTLISLIFYYAIGRERALLPS
jgi:MFS family permease